MPQANIQQYLIKEEPFYQPQGNEVALYEAAYKKRLPVMVKGPTGCGKSRFIEEIPSIMWHAPPTHGTSS